MNLLERLAARGVGVPASTGTPEATGAPTLPSPSGPPPRSDARRPGPACELCSQGLDGDHDHLVDVEARRSLCACAACRLALEAPADGVGPHRLVPRRYRRVGPAAFRRPAWKALGLPVGLTFLSTSGDGRVRAVHLRAAGPTESEPSLSAWHAVATTDPMLGGVVPEVEAVLVSVPPKGAPEAFVVPVDACDELVGALQACGRGAAQGQGRSHALGRAVAGLRPRCGAR